MGVESATFISQLQPSEPSATDLRSQGDDHLRLEKQVLQNTFPNASKAFYFPSAVSKADSFNVQTTEMNVLFIVDTAIGPIDMVLPVLTADDGGWRCSMMKTGANPVFISKSGGGIVISGTAAVTKARRLISWTEIFCTWTGSNFVISRAVLAPVGACLEMHIATLPLGYEWPNGQTLGSASTNYPEFYQINGNSGVTIDKRGRTSIALDNLGGSAAGRLGAVITGTGFGNTGGTETVALSVAQIPTLSVSSSGGNSFSVTSTDILLKNGLGAQNLQGGTNGFGWSNNPSVGTIVSSGTNTILVSGTTSGTSGFSHSNLQPSIMLAQVLVVE